MNIHTIDELSRWAVRPFVHTLDIRFSSSRTAHNLGNPGANLTYIFTSPARIWHIFDGPGSRV